MCATIRVMARTGFLLAALLAGTTGLGAWVPTLSPNALADAIALGQSRSVDARLRLHATYHVNIGRAPVDYVEVVTPFRRVVLEAEARTLAGDRLFGQRQALAVLGNEPSRVDLVVEFTFHPQNTFVGVPEYTLSLLPDTANAKLLLPNQLSRVPRFGPRLSSDPLAYPYTISLPAPNASMPLLGGRLIAAYDGTVLAANNAYWVIIAEADVELARVRVDLGPLR